MKKKTKGLVGKMFGNDEQKQLFIDIESGELKYTNLDYTSIVRFSRMDITGIECLKIFEKDNYSDGIRLILSKRNYEFFFLNEAERNTFCDALYYCKQYKRILT